jgi:septum site-determining protein MinC
MGQLAYPPSRKLTTPASRAKARLKGLLERERLEVSEAERLNPFPTAERFSVSIRGKSDGLVLRIGSDVPWAAVLRDLSDQLNQVDSRAFFQGALLHLDAGGRRIAADEIDELVALLAQYEIKLASVIDDSSMMQAYLGARDAIPPVERAQLESLATWRNRNVTSPNQSAVFVRHSLRSGEVFRHTDSLIILGNVPNAAEVVTNGDILVFGRLRGVAHAGASGNENAVVGALLLTPTQLRISHHVMGHFNSLAQSANIGELALVSDGRIVIEPWLK